MKADSPNRSDGPPSSAQNGDTFDACPNTATLDRDRLLSQTVLYATKQVDRLRWRGDPGGVLPLGYDPNSIAVEAFLQLFLSIDDPSASAGSFPELSKRLRRLVHKQVDRLWRRKENFSVRNEPDLPLLTTDDGEQISIVETIPSPEADPAQTLLDQEASARFDDFKHRFETFLGPEPRLRQLFRCFCNGITTPNSIAACLNLNCRTVDNLKQWLRRKATLFLHRLSSARVRPTACRRRREAS